MDAAARTSTPEPRVQVPLRLLIAPFAKAQNTRAWFQFGSTLALFVAGWAATAWSLMPGSSGWITLALVVPTAGFLVRLFIVHKDCG